MAVGDDYAAVDPRTERLQSLWGYGGRGDLDVILTTDPAERERFEDNAPVLRGLVAFLHGTRVPSSLAPLLRPIYRRGNRLYTEAVAGHPEASLLGYAWKNPTSDGLLDRLQQLSGRPDDIEPELGWAHVRPVTGSNIHSQVQTVTQGVNTLRFNLAAGGYLESWQVSGVEILNRGASWGRGMQQQFEWVDIGQGDLVRHCPSQAGSLYDSGIRAQGSVVVSVTETSPASGGKQVTIVTEPLEYDPEGTLSVPGVRTDHGGSEAHPILWKGVRCTTTIWLEHEGTPGLHKVSTVWSMPFTASSAFFDTGLTAALFLDTRFDELYAYDAQTDTATDVTAAADAVDWRRWSVSNLGTFQDDQASPTTATTIASAWGGMIARESGVDLAVAHAGRMHPVSAAIALSTNFFPRGTQCTYMTNRSGSTGYDGTQAVCIGLDNLLTGRWHSHDSARTVAQGESRLDRFVAIGTLASVRSLIQTIPTSY